MKRTQWSDSPISALPPRFPLVHTLVKSRSEVLSMGSRKGQGHAELVSPLNSDDEDEEDEEEENNGGEHDGEDIEISTKDNTININKPNTTTTTTSTRAQSVIINTSTLGLEKVGSNSVININNIVNINNGGIPHSPSSSKLRAESYPLSEVESLRQELINNKKSMDKLKKQNQSLVEENSAMKKMLENTNIPRAVPLSASVSVVKVGYLIKRGLTWHNWCSRWCVLRWNTLTYFKSPSDNKPKGLFHVQGCQVAEHHDPKRPNTFTVQSRTRLWYFQATSQNEQKSWMQALESAAQDRASFSKLPGIEEQATQQPSSYSKSSKLFRFFGEEPRKDWCEEDLKARFSTKKFDFASPVPKEIVEFVSEKEARIIDECGLSLKQVQVNYASFLSCAYFVTRDRYYKKRISEFNDLSLQLQASAVGNSSKAESSLSASSNNNNNTISAANNSIPHISTLRSTVSQSRLRASNRRSVNYSDATIGKMLSMQNPKDSYTFFEKVGKGGFANVYRAKHKSNKSIVAVKVLSQKFEKRNARMCHEVSMLMTCNHPNIIKNYQNFLYNEEIYMVTEYCEIGSLDRVLKLELKEPAISFILHQVLSGLVYMHNMGRVHRDIKTSNILINSLGHIKIADLGLCEDVSEAPIMGKMSGSKYWLAPEVVARQPYSMPVDIWNVGGLGCAMVTKAPPNGSMHPIKAMYLAAVQGISVSEILPKGTEWSDLFRDFLSQCFRMDPEQRPTAAVLIQHPFLKIGKRSDLVPLVNACIIAGYIV